MPPKVDKPNKPLRHITDANPLAHQIRTHTIALLTIIMMRMTPVMMMNLTHTAESRVSVAFLRIWVHLVVVSPVLRLMQEIVAKHQVLAPQKDIRN
jgi:hypothetical protein